MREPGTAQRIAAQARRILQEEGAEAVSMRRVGEAVGITAMAIYRHYPNRQALLRAVADAVSAELAASWRDLPKDGDLEERISALQDAFLDFALGSPHLYRFLMFDRWEEARSFPEDFQAGDGPFHVVADLVAEAMAAGFLRGDDPMEVTLAVTAGSQGLIGLYLSGRVGMKEDDFRALCHRTTRRLIAGLRA
ncbi:MAG: TetR/AcrR family transcriptional regulator [Nonomuraea sp.]|nr:TetR/AcrR family transcriptional regulator [Nonomuraea sp.]